ncbi:MAG: integrase [Caulobacteraceae bacterium]|nr:integrase [Caulobacteraceae bacterium]
MSGRSPPRRKIRPSAPCSFLYREVLEIDLPWLGEVDRAKWPARLLVVLRREEAQAAPARLDEMTKPLCETTQPPGDMTKGLRETTKRLCDLTKRLCRMAEPLCDVTKRLCDLTKPLCDVTKRFCHTTKRLCRVTKRLCGMTKGLCCLVGARRDWHNRLEASR